ncbi:response regulator transcription factor [Filobacillus milosensis]|uniref:Response regulator transcription factor n=1 Tax=Filobacillus milosensis TaxID=94137 RepID=A0A4Y8ITJ6_9BACI|nr:response regulator transcription factor [Filobacillus milosensis]
MYNLLIKGYTNDQIARHTYTSKHTVRTHIKNIYRKLNVHNKIDLILYYR